MSNFNLNVVIIGGRLTADPELKTTPAGISVTSFTVAVNRKAKNSEETVADFLNVTAWRQTAELVAKYFKKSSAICVIGEIQTRTWTDQEGKKRFGTEIVAKEVKFVDSKKDMAPNEGTQGAEPNYIPEAVLSSYTASTGVSNDAGDQNSEELPF